MLFIRTNTGRELSCSLCAVSFLGNLDFVLKDISLIEAANYFSNPENAEELTFINLHENDGEEEIINTYNGYTVLRQVGMYYGSINDIQVSLRRPAQ